MNISHIANNKELCCGCNSCETVCPVNAVKMKIDEVGQLYPIIDEAVCIDCSLCAKVCCENNEVDQLDTITAYAGTYCNRDSSSKSSSGGIFPALANYILSQCGIVFGTAYTNGFHVEVISVEDKKDLQKLQGSKYVKSHMGDCSKKILAEARNGRKVLFSGVPCQVAAVKQYLGEDYPNVILLDIVCHGTPSNKMFLDYLKFVEDDKKIEITDFLFRDKDVGQDTRGKVVFKQNHLGKVVFKQNHLGKVVFKQNHLRAYKSSYYKLFLNCSTFRESCYHCKFASSKRVGDITICDYWGIDEVDPEFVEQVKREGLTGISGILVNTQKGITCINDISEELVLKKTDVENIRKYNPQLVYPSQITPEHIEVMSLYKDKGYAAIDAYYHKKYRVKIATSTVGEVLPYSFKKKILDLKKRAFG